jgi:hypothetical protein
MGSFISGPIIKLSLDESGLLASLQDALGKISAQTAAANKQNGQAITASVVNPLIAQAAQLRAL